MQRKKFFRNNFFFFFNEKDLWIFKQLLKFPRGATMKMRWEKSAEGKLNYQDFWLKLSGCEEFFFRSNLIVTYYWEKRSWWDFWDQKVDVWNFNFEIKLKSKLQPTSNPLKNWKIICCPRAICNEPKNPSRDGNKSSKHLPFDVESMLSWKRKESNLL
jgi:hypothetical protein